MNESLFRDINNLVNFAFLSPGLGIYSELYISHYTFDKVYPLNLGIIAD